MRKVMIVVMILIMFIVTGCDREIEVISKTITNTKEIIIDYSSSSSLEEAINNKKEVNGKIAKLLIKELKINDNNEKELIIGSKCRISLKEDLSISSGDYIVIKIIGEIVDNNGIWEINYQLIKVINNKKSEVVEDNSLESDNNINQIQLSNDSSVYIGRLKEEVEKEFNEKGFKNIIIKEVVTGEVLNKTGFVSSVTIDGKDFKKDEVVSFDKEVVIYCWKYESVANEQIASSEYEKAFIRDLPSYDLYMMFDEDKKEVVYFGTNDSLVMTTTYSGEFSIGIDINWEKYQSGWHETFIYKGGNKATLIDGNKFEFEWVKYDVEKAEKILEKIG